MKESRNSSIELLRILCIFGVLLMHTFLAYFVIATGTNRIYGLIVNTVFNSAVSIFFLISGYYGIKYSRKKVIRFWLLLFFYSAIELIVKIHILHLNVSVDVFKQLFMPVTFNKYWFMTTYIILLIFSDYINAFVDKISKQELKKNILILLFIFSILPTFALYHSIGDSGKGIVNMVIIYLIGRYIRKYNFDIPLNKLVIYLITVIVFAFLLNYNCTYSSVGTIGITAPYTRDYSIFTVAIAVFTFLIFKKYNYYNKYINKVGSSVLMIYLADPIIRFICEHYINVVIWNNTRLLPVYAIIYCCFIFIVGLLFDIIRKFLLEKLETKIVDTTSAFVDDLFFVLKKKK